MHTQNNQVSATSAVNASTRDDAPRNTGGARNTKHVARRDTPDRIWRRPPNVQFLPAADTAAATFVGVEPRTTLVLLTGGLPGGAGLDGLRQWAGTGGWRWELQPGAYLTATQPRLTFKECDGRTLIVGRAAPWFGDQCRADDAARAWERVQLGLASKLHSPITPTPATTGRIALWNTWADRGEVWPVLPPNVQKAIRATSGQGRKHLGPGARRGSVMWRYDGRFMYGALTGIELPVGGPRHVTDRRALEQLNIYEPARYHVITRVPNNWQHVGLVGVRGPARSQLWPSTPGTEAQAWIDGCELLNLRRYNWPTVVMEAVVWPGRARPLALWGKRIAALRDAAESAAERYAWRSLVLHTIGALHGTPHRVTASGPNPPDNAEKVMWVSPTLAHWVELRSPAMRELCHPEWTAHLWARARLRLSDKLLDAPYGQLVGCDTDAVYVSAEQTDWRDDGRDGTYRPAGTFHRPWAALRTMPDLYRYAGEEGDDE